MRRGPRPPCRTPSSSWWRWRPWSSSGGRSLGHRDVGGSVVSPGTAAGFPGPLPPLPLLAPLGPEGDEAVRPSLEVPLQLVVVGQVVGQDLGEGGGEVGAAAD